MHTHMHMYERERVKGEKPKFCIAFIFIFTSFYTTHFSFLLSFFILLQNPPPPSQLFPSHPVTKCHLPSFQAKPETANLTSLSDVYQMDSPCKFNSSESPVVAINVSGYYLPHPTQLLDLPPPLPKPQKLASPFQQLLFFLPSILLLFSIPVPSSPAMHSVDLANFQGI